MPRDAFGNVAHIVADPNSVNARTNPARFWMAGINWVSAHIHKLVIEQAKTDKLKAFDLLVEYYNDIRPLYAEKVLKVYGGSDRKKIKHVDYVCDNFVKLHIPPGWDGVDLEWYLNLCHKWKVPSSPVTFIQRDEYGIAHPVTTEKHVRMGRTYMHLLEKIPHLSSPGFARVSHQGYPIKASHDAKIRIPISINPIKIGEDETRFIGADAGMEELTRYTNLLGNSPKAGVTPLIRTLMTSTAPTAIGRVDVTNEAMMQGNTILGTLHHETSILGIDTKRTRFTEYDQEMYRPTEGDDVLFHMDDSED